MLKTRIVTASVLLLVLALALYLRGPYFETLMALAFALAMAEWLDMLELPRPLVAFLFVVTLVAMSVLVWRGTAMPVLLMVIYIAACCWWLALSVRIWTRLRTGLLLPRWFSLTLALTLPWAAWLGVWLVHAQWGTPFLLSVFAVIWLADIGAYFVGRAIGRHKLAPAISPGKTWEGLFGALLLNLLVAWLVPLCWPDARLLWNDLLGSAGLWPGLGLVALLTVVSVVGDLFESAVKRQAGRKDSGRILPGHGGCWDRLDSSIAVFTLVGAVMAFL